MAKPKNSVKARSNRIDDTQNLVVNAVKAYRSEADSAVVERMERNRDNWDCYHLRQNYDDKIKGQSQEFLPKVSMAVEQAANFIQQGLTDVGDWFKVEPEPGLNEDIMLLKPDEIRKMLNRQLAKCQVDNKGFVNLINDAAKMGLLASQMIFKVHGRWVPKVTYSVKERMKDGIFTRKLIKKEDKKWQLQIDLVSPNNYRVDPTKQGLFELEDTFIDYYKLKQLAEEKDSPYDLKVIEEMNPAAGDSGSTYKMNQAREQGLSQSSSQYRRMVKVTELWGNILDSEGNLVYENVVCAIADDTWLIRKPEPNPLWHGESPYVTATLISVPNSPIGKALMDAPTMLNQATNELFNLVLDGGLMGVHGIKQIRKHWLDDPSQIEEGIPPGTTLTVNSSCPPGATVLERVDTSSVPADGLNVLNLLNQEGNAASLTNDLRMGVASFRQVKATEVAEASQSITSMFSGIAKQIEMGAITPVLEKCWKTMLQNMDDLETKEIEALLGSRRAAVISKLSREKLFAECVQGAVFKVFGISAVLNKQKDFTKLTALLQTIAASPVLMEAYSQKYGFNEFLTEIMRSLDINPDKLAAPKEDGGDLTQGADQTTPQGAPDMQSQIPQAGAAENQGDLSAMSTATSAVQGTKFPASRATPAQGAQ